MASDGGDRAPESPSSSATNSTRIAARSSLVDSIRSCGLSGMRIDKEDLKRRLLIPEYLRLAMIEAIRRKEPNVRPSVPPGSTEAPDAPMIIFINSHSGGRHGPILKGRLEQLMGEEQVFDILTVKPSDFVQYGLACLESIADCGDNCARETREKLRVMVAGGDGTVGWVLGSLAELYKEKREPVPPLGIIPLGTGNDLARSFGWGGSFPFAWRSAIKRSLFKAVSGPICRLDSWHVVVSMPSKEDVEMPHSLKRKENSPLYQDGDIEGHFPDTSTCFEGVFYNYFSIGMDARVAYGFHHLRDEKPNLANGPIANKLIYSGYSCTQGWFFTPCTSDPGLRGLNNILRLHIKKVNCSEWEQIQVPSRIHPCDPNDKDTLWPAESGDAEWYFFPGFHGNVYHLGGLEECVRALVALNLHNYGSGSHPWGNLKPDYLEKRGFVEAHSDDGLLEIFGLKHGWHASFVMVELISAKHIAQAAAIRVEIRGDQWKDAFMQMDGEPWKQPIKNQYSTVVEIKRVPFRSLVINGE